LLWVGACDTTTWVRTEANALGRHCGFASRNIEQAFGLVYYKGMVTAAEVDAEQELASLCGGLNASYARLVAVVAQALADESWAGGGIRSPQHWLTMRAGLSPFRARAVPVPGQGGGGHRPPGR
jgi:hypothetical protein